MPKQVDHEARRREIAASVARLAQRRGLQGVTFREVAAEAGVSVSLVQHYFGTKANLLTGTLDFQSAVLDEYILDRVADLGPDPRPLDYLRTVARAFLPTDATSRASTLLYLGFAGAALTDAELRRAEAFRHERNLRAVIAEQLSRGQRAGEIADDLVPEVEARALLGLVVGLSLSVLLDQTDADAVEVVLDAHLARLASERRAVGARRRG